MSTPILNKYSTERDFLLIVFSIILPPLAVYIEWGTGRKFWLNVLLSLLGYLPGLVHAVWAISRY
ncbi:MAG: hypothetical protein K0S29_879 [Gammaproteobacteria bacterium]|jgi:uncharacterized membrane protein YqaE (UPF0057 family)|nr:hypothetical protein [Gammaproteobacteria bacterium]